MKTQLNKIILAAIIAVAFFGCDIKDPAEGLEVRLNSIARETLVTGYVYDASSGSTIAQNVTVTFTGQNAQNIVDETNDPVSKFTVKEGIFNFALKDGIIISESNPFRVIAKITSNGYVSSEVPLVIRAKGVQAFSFFLAKAQDFGGSINTNNVSNTGTTNSSGTTTSSDTTTTTSGTTVIVPGGTTITTSTGTPLVGSLNSNITTTVFNNNTTTLQPNNTAIGGGQGVVAAMGISFELTDNQGNIAANLSQPVQVSFSAPDNLIDPTTGSSFPVNDSIPLWSLNSSGSYVRYYPSAFLSAGEGIVKLKSPDSAPSITLKLWNSINLLMGNPGSLCTPVLQITNPIAGFPLQIFSGSLLIYSGSVTGTITGSEVFIPAGANIPISLKYNANVTNGTGGHLYASTSYSVANCGSPVSVTLNYPAESITAQVKVSGVCTSRDPIVRVYPTITFNYRKKGSGGAWQQGSLNNGIANISGLEANTTYEAKATYRDKEATVEITVISATNFTIGAGINQGSLLRSEVTGSQVVNGISVVSMEIDIDLGDDCD